MRLVVGSDHGGFLLKEEIVAWLTTAGRAQQEFDIDEVVDAGPDQLDPDDDYPIIAAKVSRMMQDQPNSLGILLCRSGQGVALVANKFAGIRAAVAWNRQVAAAGRTDDAINLLCLPADYVTPDEAIEICDAWLTAEAAPAERYRRRLEEIAEIEAEVRGE